jgi:copper transport protein
VALLVLAAVISPGVVLAHAVLVRATPSGSQTLAEAPQQVQLLFSEALDPNFSSVQVLAASGARVDLADSHVDPANDRLLVASLQPQLASGIYTVVWRSLSAIDVHPDEGQYRLFVGVPVTAEAATVSSPVQNTGTPEATLARWWFYVAASLFGGVLATWKLVISPLFRGETRIRAVARRRVHRLIIVGGSLLVVGTLFSALAQAAAAAEVPLMDAFGRPLSDLLLRGRFASLWWPRFGLEVASLALIALGGVDGLASECALAIVPAVLLTSALTSHGAALASGVASGIVIDWLHIVGATAWVGGLLALITLLPALRRSDDSGVTLERLVSRFGRLALVAATVVLLSGVWQGALEVGSWDALLATLYGQLLLIKVGLLLGMLLLAGVNEWHVRASGTLASFGRGVRVELALGVVVFAVAAMLSGTPPTPNS